MVRKGTRSSAESYSAFYDAPGSPTELEATMAAAEVTDVFVAGLAFDVCVGTCVAIAGEQLERKQRRIETYVLRGTTDASIRAKLEVWKNAHLPVSGVHCS